MILSIIMTPNGPNMTMCANWVVLPRDQPGSNFSVRTFCASNHVQGDTEIIKTNKVIR